MSIFNNKGHRYIEARDLLPNKFFSFVSMSLIIKVCHVTDTACMSGISGSMYMNLLMEKDIERNDGIESTGLETIN